MSQKASISGAHKSAVALVGISAVIACIPGIGFLMWLVGGAVSFVVFILSIVMLAKGETVNGIVGLFLSLALPIWLFAAPIASTAVFDASRNNPETPPSDGASSGEAPAPKSPASPPGSTVSAAVAEAVAEPEALVAEREWSAADGRKMRAALLDVVRGADGKFVGKFLRDDGREFDLEISKLSRDDIAEVKRAMTEAGLWHGGE